MKKIRIAVLASNFIRIPPRPKDIPPQCSGAPEMIASQITEELVKRGHDVTLFASGDSKTSAKLISVTKKATSKDPKIGFIPMLYTAEGKTTGSSRFHEPYEFLLIEKAYKMAANFDIIHSHFDIMSAFFAPFVKTPTVSTLHSPLVGLRKIILDNFKKTQYYISISDSQRKTLPNLKYAATIHHGLDLKKIPMNLKPDNYLVFTGRIHPSKGVKEAIEVAKKASLPLVIMGKHGNDEYWKEKIMPQIDNKKIIYKGFLSQKEMYKIIGNAKAYIFPLQWEEPFGLTLIEAMACGTPVISFDKGSISEIVKNDKTGFIVENNDGIVRALKKIDQIDRGECREWVEKNFSIKRMIDDYEKTFLNIFNSTLLR
jgi:glycosyltransferase involved in cell wall biosynthesis